VRSRQTYRSPPGRTRGAMSFRRGTQAAFTAAPTGRWADAAGWTAGSVRVSSASSTATSSSSRRRVCAQPVQQFVGGGLQVGPAQRLDLLVRRKNRPARLRASSNPSVKNSSRSPVRTENVDRNGPAKPALHQRGRRRRRGNHHRPRRAAVRGRPVQPSGLPRCPVRAPVHTR